MTDVSVFSDRIDRVRARMAEVDVDVLLLSVGPDLPWLSGYEAMPLERMTMLVVPADREATLVVPRLEALRVVERPDVFGMLPWDEQQDPVAIVAELVGHARSVAIGDQTWARFVVDLQSLLPAAGLSRGIDVTGPLRAVKDPAEIDALRRAGAAADRVAAQLQAGDIALVGRTEAEVSADIGRRLVDEGHARVNFAIVASAANAASPHHDAGSRVIQRDEVVLCDFGGTMFDGDGVGYCSDITRCVWTGPVPAEVTEIYDTLYRAQAASVASVTVGATCHSVDAEARKLIADDGWGENFIHRTGHGIGVEAHEDPYIVAGNTAALVAGNAFSIEPGIYLPGRFGFRLEDIVVVDNAGADPLNAVDHRLIPVVA